jgi:hypothetical protein
MAALRYCTGFRPVPLQMNRSILFYFFNKMRQNCPFCSKKIIEPDRKEYTHRRITQLGGGRSGEMAS